jgi:hypothetical protein
VTRRRGPGKKERPDSGERLRPGGRYPYRERNGERNGETAGGKERV